jgi:hypothetical protein
MVARLLAMACAACLAAGPVHALSGHESCVDVQVGTAQSYACINQTLADAARQANKSATQAAPYGIGSPANQTGQFNEDATRNRLGTNFGKSVTPAGQVPQAAGTPR